MVPPSLVPEGSSGRFCSCSARAAPLAAVQSTHLKSTCSRAASAAPVVASALPMTVTVSLHVFPLPLALHSFRDDRICRESAAVSILVYQY